MQGGRRFEGVRRWVVRLGVALLATAALHTSLAQSAPALEGVVTDALSGAPIGGAEVYLPGGEPTETAPDGSYRLALPRDASDRRLRIEASGYFGVTLVDQRPGVLARHPLLPRRITPADLLACDETHPCFGVPMRRLEARAIPGAPLRIGPGVLPAALSAPASLPPTLRVARRFASSCRNNPIVRIDEIPFEDYVAGVLPAEIGVFKAVPSGPDSVRATFAAFAVLARTYALWWYVRSGGASAEYHLDDTACNQRYDDTRDAWITSVVQSTAGQILVSAADPTLLDKYEYAASCGRHGTLPEYQTDLVPDQPGVVGCTRGGWCGHDTCNGHQDNPNLPPGNKCLVRGTCQWGSLEWALAGKDETFILAHYEPNLQRVTLGTEPTAVLVGFVREGDIHTGANIAGARVVLDTGAETTTDITGFYRLTGVPLGTVTVTASAPGYHPASRQKTLDAAWQTFWASIALRPEGADGGVTDGGALDASVADAGGSGDGGGLPGDGGSRPDGEIGGGGGGSTGGGGCHCATTAASPAAGLALWCSLVALLPWRRRE